MVKWEKGMNLDRTLELCKEVPIPFVVHFRIPTAGGRHESLCHPFPIAKHVPLDLKGATKGYVLFHNGHWTQWKDTLLKAAVTLTAKLPGGKWSDSRGMAWMAAHYGIGVLDLIDEKAVAFGPNDIEVASTGWSKEDTVWCSNTHWKVKQWNPTGGQHGHHMGSFRGPATEYDYNHLPQAYHKKGDDEDTVIIDTTGTTKVGGKGGQKKALIPFALACQLWGKGEISRKQWKRSIRAHNETLWKARQKGMEDVPPIILKEQVH